MDEHEILVKVHSFKKLHIPEGAFIWSWWKQHYLEVKERRDSLRKEAFDFESFKKTIKDTTRPSKCFPTFVRDDNRKIRNWIKEFYIYYTYILSPDLPFEIQESNYGLGLTARGPTAISKEYLWGILYYITDDTRDALIELKYPSLFQKGSDTAIVCGPVSLINHSCGSPFGFSEPSKKYANEDIELFFGGCDMIHINQFRKKSLQAGEEITAKYSKKDQLNFKCKCKQCFQASEYDNNNCKKRKRL